jgi:hypothetical protein
VRRPRLDRERRRMHRTLGCFTILMR